MKTVKIKCPKPFGVLIAPEATKYLESALSGVDKVLIVADERVFRLYGNALKKVIKASCDKTYTFIYPSGESGKTKHVLDKLLILMTELGITDKDCVVAFGGRSSASITGLATHVFNGGVPYIFIPTTLMAMINPVLDGSVGVDFLGQKNLLCATNYPVACFVDTEYLKTLPEESLRDGYAEIIRRAMICDGKLIREMQAGSAEMEQMIYVAIKLVERAKSPWFGMNKKSRFALNFSQVAQKVCASGIPYDRLIGFGIITAIDTAMALGVSYGLDEPMLNLLKKYGIKWDIGLSINRTWSKIGEYDGNKIVLALPKRPGCIKLVRLSKAKIKDSF